MHCESKSHRIQHCTSAWPEQMWRFFRENARNSPTSGRREDRWRLIKVFVWTYFPSPGFSMAMVPPYTHFATLLLLLHFLAASPVIQDDLVINTSLGKVRGKLLPVLGGNVRAFLGIPYGKPPVGKLRFKAPMPVERWEGVKDAIAFPNSCYQLVDTTFPGRMHVYIDGIFKLKRSNWFCGVLYLNDQSVTRHHRDSTRQV